MANGDLAAKEGSIGHPLYALLSRVSIRHGRQEIMKLRVQLGGEIPSVTIQVVISNAQCSLEPKPLGGLKGGLDTRLC